MSLLEILMGEDPHGHDADKQTVDGELPYELYDSKSETRRWIRPCGPTQKYPWPPKPGVPPVMD